MAKKKSTKDDNLQELESALTKTEQFIEDNQNDILDMFWRLQCLKDSL